MTDVICPFYLLALTGCNALFNTIVIPSSKSYEWKWNVSFYSPLFSMILAFTNVFSFIIEFANHLFLCSLKIRIQLSLYIKVCVCAHAHTQTKRDKWGGCSIIKDRWLVQWEHFNWFRVGLSCVWHMWDDEANLYYEILFSLFFILMKHFKTEDQSCRHSISQVKHHQVQILKKEPPRFLVKWSAHLHEKGF